MTTEQEYTDNAKEIEAAQVGPGELAKARALIGSCAYTTTAIAALVAVIRKQYDDAREAGCEVVEGTPCADILASILPALAAAEAREV